ncbi:3'-5' exonuclease [Pseudorhodoferax sp. Leaf267]|uniref:3'-5' exonuclease n=1 Tax=Pseudorhodoferax sp. Leaf267 TaxID=1736316 RepID=UPI0006FD0D7B|nr:3'-5' exonuclease [Pseudorhodoferax sp. Leaf267]KQP22574.1 DNA polymerase III subunit epsilon [Pseudorhodoferax sp. Leaf267]
MQPFDRPPVAQWGPALRRWWGRRRLKDPHFRFLWDTAPPDEWVSLDCETTGLDRQRDEIVAIGAVRIRGNRVMTSERLELLVQPALRKPSADSVRIHQLREQDLAQGLPAEDAVRQLLHFIGPRTLVGYYLEFDVAMLNRVVQPLLGTPLPQPQIEVSAMYYDHVNRQRPPEQRHGYTDLRFATLMGDLELPQRPAHDAVSDAVMAALAFVKLRAIA